MLMKNSARKFNVAKWLGRRFVHLTIALTLVALAGPLLSAWQQGSALSGEKKLRLLNAQEVKDAMPATVFFRGQSAPVQFRNTGGIRTQAGQLLLAGLVDNSGYSTGTAEKYQGYLLTEMKLDLMGKQVAPGAYGIGFLNDGTFLLMDIGENELLRLASKKDGELKRPRPFSIVEAGSGFRLYMGKQYVDFTLVQ